MPIQFSSRDFNHRSSATSDTVGFQQQGQFDWVGLGQNSLTASIQILSRISAAGIDPFTIVLGQAIGGSFLWRDEGRDRFDKALQACQGLAGYQNVLWFGFGVKHVAHVLTATDQGSICAAMFACLAECYSVPFAAEIILEMTKASKPPFETTPSLQQWRNLVNSCAGLVSRSNFGIHAEQIMRLEGERYVVARQTRADHGRSIPSRGIASKVSIAETLLGLAKLSRGILHQMTVIGRANAGLIAAIADWLLGLDVEVRGGPNQDTLYKKCKSSFQPQLLIIYQKDVPEDSIQCVGHVYRLPDATQLIKQEDGAPMEVALSGRVPWEGALENTFGSDFRKLMMMKQAFGSMIGSAARIFQAIYEADKEVPREWLINCRSYYPQSYGSSYIHFILARFPELQGIRDATYSGFRKSVRDAVANYEAQAMSLATGCGCQKVCRHFVQADGTKTEEEECIPNPPPYCLVIQACTIIRVARYLSGIITELHPMRAGLEFVYDVLSNPWQLNSVENIIDGQLGHDSFADRYVLLHAAEIIFGGRRPIAVHQPKDVVSAYAVNGLCYFLDVLTKPTLRAAWAARVHVLPGRLEYLGRAYDLLKDCGDLNPLYSGVPRGRDHSSQGLSALNDSHNGRIEVLVSEAVSARSEVALSIEFGISKDGSIRGAVGPARAVQAMSKYEGLIPCRRKDGCSPTPYAKEIWEAAITSQRSGDPYCCQKVAEKELSLIHGNIVTGLLALTNMENPLVQRDECISCCVQVAVLSEQQHVTVIASQNALTLGNI